MLASYTWLKELTGCAYAPEELAQVLTSLGMAVDAVTRVGCSYERVVVGEIVKIERHPQADNLTVCQVNVGAETVQIVCGAPNAAQGLRVPVALIGARLCGDLVIRKAKLRGVESFGMCCAADELGISADHTGLLTLGADVAPGTPLSVLLAGEDQVLELDTPNNRPDLLNHVGIAREIAAYRAAREKGAAPFVPPAITLPETGEQAATRLRIRIDERELCPRYTARLIRGVRVGRAPLWMQARLFHLGMRPINNIVDITNYVLLEYGHPLHAFDAATIAGNEIIVRRAKAGETLVTLDGVKRALDPQMLVIADTEKPVALAGVMGGANTEVTAATDTVLLESAYFNGPNIRRTGKRLGLSSQASQRFERGVRGAAVAASNRAAELMTQHAHGAVLPGLLDVNYSVERPPITVSLPRCARLLGRAVSGEDARCILTALGFGVDAGAADTLAVRAPEHRVDVAEWPDIAEDICRVLGYDTIPALAHATIEGGGALPRTEQCRRLVRTILSGAGLYEACNTSLISPAILDAAGIAADAPERALVRIDNAASEEQSVMRSALYPGLVQNLLRNVAQGAATVRLFEIGRAYRATSDGRAFAETETLALLLWGQRNGEGWWGAPGELDIHDCIGVAEVLAAKLGIAAPALASSVRPGCHPGRCATISAGGDGPAVALGWIAELDPQVTRALDVPGRVVAAELNLEALAGLWQSVRPYHALPRFPAATRDVAFMVAETCTHGAICAAITAAGVALVESVRLFDIYRGAQVAAGMKSMAYRITYRAADRTLTDAEIDAAHAAVVAALVKAQGIQVR